MCKRDEERHILCLASQLSSHPYHHIAGLVTRFKPAQGHACDNSTSFPIECTALLRIPEVLSSCNSIYFSRCLALNPEFPSFLVFVVR